MLLATMFLGFLLAKQIDAKVRVDRLNSPQNISDNASEVVEVVNSNNQLRQDLSTLLAQKNTLLNTSSSKAASDESVTNEINQLKVITGQADVSGPGVEITFNNNLQLTSLVDLINALRNIGGEAIMIGNTRVIVSTPLTDKMGLAPVKIKVIGDKKILSDSLLRSGGIIEQIDPSGKVVQKDKIEISKVKGN
jgi:uncharacterized protein YlxW (UPF0749 family)